MPKTVLQIQRQIEQKQNKKAKLSEDSKKMQAEIADLKVELQEAKKVETEKKKKAKAKKTTTKKK